MPTGSVQPVNIVTVAFDDLNAFAFLKTLYPGTLNTPNLDRLMGMGTTFENTFAQIAVCNASRTSVLSGLDPSLTGVYHNYDAWFDAVDPRQTLPALLRGNGFYTGLFGKVFHDQPPEGIAATIADVIFRTGNLDLTGATNPRPSGRPLEEFADYMSTSAAIDFLQQNGDDPFALFLGILKPHLSWEVPQEYYDMYPLDSIELPYALDGDLSDVPAFMRALITDDQGVILSTIGWKAALQGYFASITFADAMFGRLLDALEESGHLDDTAIVVWTDHGFHLGDKDDWHKFTLWDEAGRAPMIVALPGAADDGQRVTEVVELVDLMPTILDIMGVPAPTGLSGRSLVPFIENPALDTDGYAVTTMYGSVSIRTADYRYTLYEDGSMELYNIVTDPNQWVNLALQPGFFWVRWTLDYTLKTDLAEQGWIWVAPGASMTGSAGNDLIVGGQAIRLAGGTGDDTYFVRSGTEQIVEQAQGGNDMIVSDQSTRLPANVENFQQRNATRNINITGNDLNNHISGNGTILGLGGDDVIITTSSSTVEGGDGNDHISGRGNFSTYYGGAGNDILESSMGEDLLFGGDGDDRLSADMGEDVLRGEAGHDVLEGGRNDDQLFGGIGNDVLDGGGGADMMVGGAGDDVYWVNETGDTVLEGVNEGTDTVRANLSYTLGTNFERLELLGVGHWQAIGNGLNNVLIGNAGDNLLNGGAGADSMSGGLGNDTYVVNESGDTVSELSGEGTDTVQSKVSYTLGANLERLVLTEAAHVQGFGNGLANVLTGNAGNNLLDGRGGADTMIGGLGNDTYYVDQTGDIVTERLSEGIDTVRAAVSYTLANHVERLILDGSANLAATGNVLANVLIGNAGNNLLDGRGGADTMSGGLGNDVYAVNEAGDVVTEAGGEGIDTVNAAISYALTANVERLVLGASGNLAGTGNDLSNVLTGNAFANLLEGLAGADVLHGDDGADRLDGGLGKDVLDLGDDVAGDIAVFRTIADSLVGAQRDTVNQFSGGQDRIDLSLIDADTALAGDQAFRFTMSRAGANSVWFVQSGANVIVRADVNGDAVQDFEVLISGIGQLNARDFVL